MKEGSGGTKEGMKLRKEVEEERKDVKDVKDGKGKEGQGKGKSKGKDKGKDEYKSKGKRHWHCKRQQPTKTICMLLHII